MELNLKEISFEKALINLENIVKTLEHGEISLEESVKLFENGMEQMLICTQKINSAQQQINMLVKENNTFVKKNFDLE